MGKQSNSVSPSDKALLSQRATEEFTRVFTEVHNLFTQQLERLSQSGALGGGSIEASEAFKVTSTQAAVLQTSTAIAGLGAMALGFPIPGAALMAGGGAVANWMVQDAQLSYTQQLTLGNARMAASLIAATNGGSGATIYKSFIDGLAPERYGVGVEQMQGYASIDRQGIPFGIQNFQSLLHGTMTGLSPEGNVPVATMQAGAMQALASLNHRSIGFNPTDYLRSRGVEYNIPGESRDAFESRLKSRSIDFDDPTLQKLFKDYHGSVPDPTGFDFQQFKDAVSKNGIGVDGKVKLDYQFGGQSEIQLSSSAMTDLFNTNRTQASKGLNADFIREILFIGGPQAASAIRERYGSSKKTMDDLASVEKGDYNDYLTEQYVSSRSGVQASIYAQTGRYSEAGASLSNSGATMQRAANRLKSIAFDSDGNVVNDEAAQKYMEMTADATQKLLSASQMAYGAAGIDVGRNSAYAQVGQKNYALYGNQTDLIASFDKQAAAIGGDIARTSKRINSGLFSGPDEEAQLRSTLISLMQQEATVRTEQIRAIDSANIRIATFGAGIASAEQRSAYTLGTGGIAGQGYATNTFQQFARRASTAAKATDDIVTSMRNRNMTDEQIANSEVYQNSLLQQRQAEGDANEAFVNQANVPTSVGIRRSMSRNQFEYSFLQNFPGAAGNVWNAGRNLLSDIERANQEDQARYQKLLQEGAFNAPGGQALAEQFQNRYQDRMQTYGQVYGSLSYDWPNKLAQLVAGSPNTINYISPSLTERVAVGAGIHAPLFGSNTQDLPGYMKEASSAGSLAGSFGTPEGFAVSAMTGFSGNRGNGGMLPGMGNGGNNNIVITGELIIRDDGRATIRAKVDPRATTRTSNHDVSSSGLGEFSAMSGRGKTW